MKHTAVALALFAVAIPTGCASCESCKQTPGWDGRYATHDKGALNREMTRSKQEKAADEQE
jgi:hypothetical protein